MAGFVPESQGAVKEGQSSSLRSWILAVMRVTDVTGPSYRVHRAKGYESAVTFAF